MHLGAPQSTRNGLLVSMPVTSEKEDVANRNLIEAATDLLAACEAAISIHDVFGKRLTDGVANKLRNAIAKAKGDER